MAMTQRTGDPRLGMRTHLNDLECKHLGHFTMRSYVDGVEDLAYVLGTCLINYGSVIGAELVKSAVSKSKAGNTRSETASTPFEHTGLHQEVEVQPADTQTNATVLVSPVDLPSKRPNSEPDAMDIDQKEPKCSRKRDPAPRQTSSGRKSTPGGFGQSQQQDGPSQEEIQLREQIKSMKVDLEEDATVLAWDEVFGLEPIKIALEEFATFFLHFPHLTRRLRHRSTTGILLFGPQGTGKTLLIKSFAVKFNLSLYDIRASAIMSKFVGESEKFIRALFAEVRANMPAILMLDECDGLLCNPNADSAQSHHYRLLQNELKNQWSDLVYSRDEVIVVGATNKPHDIDMDGFGRRLSLKLHVELPNNNASQSIIKAAMGKVSHNIDDDGFQTLGYLCHDRGLSGYDVDCLVEAQLRKAIRKITLAKAFKEMEYLGDALVVPCAPTDPDAQIGPWTELTQDYEKISYVPFSFDEIKVAIQQARPTVDSYMVQKHVEFASQYATNLD
ncbi:Vacuolar protein sorting-associated protein 4 [Exophiala xenobiotica]|nr:hypothetical protein LTR40_004490 [Exophiala xenobiotica]KAK5323196.1 Vacuolar protein sorting-associated protein 4 [Exophiala xenobiotica]KAK5338097.1 Vacuolar protein sorting-associated protein 4 [Exophiala xenobiotica]KAK5419236.1 Vacuolar protein sorting-associated protein 4 [Exophiala xenobiotica]KAK5466724.1 Vacuolar protein sorting-associated protein 4 [Exophiala xenobiotica]